MVNPAQGIKKNAVDSNQNFIFHGLALKLIRMKMKPIIATTVDIMGTNNTMSTN
jgi:hypothetical protein